MSDRATRNSILAGILVLVLLAVGGGLLIEAFIARERGRDLEAWEARLGLAAEARADGIARLLARDRRALEELAANAALQAYFGQLLAAPEAGEEPAERGYLRNLLVTTAARDGWTDPAAGGVGADVRAVSRAGLALVAADGRVLVPTPGLDGLTALLAAAAAPGAPPVSLGETPDGDPVLVFAVPVAPVLGADAAGEGRPAGVLVGLRDPATGLYPLLTRGPAFAEDGEALLLAASGDGVLYLSPTRDGFGDLHRTTPLVRARLAEAAAVRDPGGFVALDDHAGRPVLQASRRVRGQPWVVAQQVDAGQALALADERRGFLLLALGLLLVAILALAVSAWRHGSSVRAAREARSSRDQADRLARQGELLRTIADASDAPTLLLDRARVVRFNNAAALGLGGEAGPSLVDRALGSAVPPPLARALAELADHATTGGTTRRQLLDAASGPDGRRWQASAVPVPVLGADRDLVLVILQDVTGLEADRARHDELLRRLVDALVGALDRRDPHAGQHGVRVAAVADALAVELALPAEERANLHLAAVLANVGKVDLPAELLTRAGPLEPAERALVQGHVERSLELLAGLPFAVPVLAIIAQKQEHLDGSGYPRGLRGDALTLPGRILAVANAFVALASTRAWRPGRPAREAAAAVLADAGTRYDARVAGALVHIAGQHPDWDTWAK